MLLKLKFSFFYDYCEVFHQDLSKCWQVEQRLHYTKSLCEGKCAHYLQSWKQIHFQNDDMDPAIKQSGLQPDTYNLDRTHLLFVGSCEWLFILHLTWPLFPLWGCVEGAEHARGRVASLSLLKGSSAVLWRRPGTSPATRTPSSFCLQPRL